VFEPAQPRRDCREAVARAYDLIGALYNAARSNGASGDPLRPLLEVLPAGSRVLDLGCGAGLPVTRELARDFDVVGVDFSRRQLALAREQVPTASFLLADMAACEFREDAFDAVVCFFAIFHLPREQQASLIERINAWLKPGGYFLTILGSEDEPGYTEDGFFGTEMFWSTYNLADYKALLRRSGFEVLQEDLLVFDDITGGEGLERHPLVLARSTRKA
jgi:cyclopropane fatty-acyl-phospholipid synthase-like methyltransferase